MGDLAVTSAPLTSTIGWSDSEEPRAGLAIEARFSIQAGNFVNFGSKVLRGKKDTPHYLVSTWYEQQMSLASTWNVVFSDTDTHRHWLLDGASAIVLLCKASLQLPYANGTAVEDIWHDQSPSSPETALKLLLHKGNRNTQVLASTEILGHEITSNVLNSYATNNDDQAGWTLEDLVLQLWRTLDLLYHDCQMPSPTETIDIEIKPRIHRGYELRDLIEGESILKPRTIQLKDSAREWYPLVQTIGTINLLGSELGELVRPRIDSKSHC